MVVAFERVSHLFRVLLSHTVNTGVGFHKHYVHHRDVVFVYI